MPRSQFYKLIRDQSYTPFTSDLHRSGRGLVYGTGSGTLKLLELYGPCSTDENDAVTTLALIPLIIKGKGSFQTKHIHLRTC